MNYFKVIDIFAEHRPGLLVLLDKMPYYEFQEYIDILKERLEQKKERHEQEEKKYGNNGDMMKDMKRQLPKMSTPKMPSFKPPKF